MLFYNGLCLSEPVHFCPKDETNYISIRPFQVEEFKDKGTFDIVSCVPMRVQSTFCIPPGKQVLALVTSVVFNADVLTEVHAKQIYPIEGFDISAEQAISLFEKEVSWLSDSATATTTTKRPKPDEAVVFLTVPDAWYISGPCFLVCPGTHDQLTV